MKYIIKTIKQQLNNINQIEIKYYT